MGLIGIGDAARSLGLNPSALRYYEERGLLQPATRQAGRRMYDTAQLRRLVLIQMMQRLGIPLDTAAAIMDEPRDTWRDSLARQIEQLDELIARATLARDFLTHATGCPADHPFDECTTLLAALDRRLSGVTFEQLVQEHGTVDNTPSEQ
jgi:DNA-binding transcriptional MerR regulator